MYHDVKSGNIPQRLVVIFLFVYKVENSRRHKNSSQIKFLLILDLCTDRQTPKDKQLYTKPSILLLGNKGGDQPCQDCRSDIRENP